MSKYQRELLFKMYQTRDSISLCSTKRRLIDCLFLHLFKNLKSIELCGTIHVCLLFFAATYGGAMVFVKFFLGDCD